MSLQSGDDAVLRNVNRRYTSEQYYEKVALIRKYFPEAAVTADIIVGYPTESDEAFGNSLAFCKKVGFADMHVFPYSSRKGTVAGKLPVLPSAAVAERQPAMTALTHELSTDNRLKQLGKSVEVLFETKEDGLWCGHTPNYVKVYAVDGARNALATVVPTALFGDGVRV